MYQTVDTPLAADAPVYLCYPIGKIVQYMNRPYGVCYVTYEKCLVDETAPPTSHDMFKRGFTLPDPSLLRCNLFALLLALEFVATNVKKKELWPRIIFVLKHSGTYQLVTDKKIRTCVDLKKNNWPRHLVHNRRFLERIITTLTTLGSQVTLVEPSRNDDTNLEFYINCDQDPLSEENKEQEPKDKEEFDRMMRIARHHKQGMADLLDVGGHSYAKKIKCRPKKEQLIPSSSGHPQPPPQQRQQPQPPVPQQQHPHQQASTTTTTTHQRSLQAQPPVPSLCLQALDGDDDQHCMHIPEDDVRTSSSTTILEELARSLSIQQQEEQH